MKRIITKDLFIKIFENPKYRKKLDKMILNFFGLDTNKQEESESITEDDVVLEFILFINTEYILKIIVKDTKKLFTTSKKFYINLSYREVEKYHELLMPCYWEIYCPYSLKHLKKQPKLILIAALLSCKDKTEIEMILKELSIFSTKEIKDIINMIEDKKDLK